MNWSALTFALVPAGVVTAMAWVAAAWAGETALIWVEETTLKLVAATPPKSTLVAPVKPVPVMVTVVPPVVGPEVGEMAVMAGGAYFSQQVGAGSNRELTDFMMGPQPVSEARSTDRAVSLAARAGLQVVDLRQEILRTVFYDVGAVVYFLRKVPWTVPGFSAELFEGVSSRQCMR